MLFSFLSNLSGPIATDPVWVFFIMLLTILLAPMVLSRLRVPQVVGLILAGVLVGEFGLHLLNRDSSFELFGQVGIFYIMFLAGLELDMGSVKQYAREGITFGLLTFAAPFILGYGASRWLLGLHILPSILVCCLLSSHTLVSYPIVARYGLTRHRTVVVSVVATAFALFTALLVIAFVTGLQNPNTTALTWLFFGLKCAAYIAFVVLLLPRVCRWFLRRYDDSVTQYISVLTMLYLSALLARMAGLEGLLGAFLAGLVINRYVPRTGPLMNRIKFVGNAIFIPYFLIGVGMMVDLRVLGHGVETLWLVGVMVITATAGKWLGAWLMHKWHHGPAGQLWIMFGLTNAHAAGALAIVMIGAAPEVGLISPELLNGAVMVILFSCIISSFATNYGGRLLALSDTTLDDNRGSYHGRCLVAYSHKSHIESMTQLAILIRNPYIPDSLMGLSVTLDDVNGNDGHQQAKELLEKAQRLAAAADVHMNTLNRMSTNVAGGIIHTIKEYDVGEVILSLTDRHTSLGKEELSGVINNVLAGSHREVMVLRAIVPLGTLDTIVVAVPEKAEYEVGFYKWLEHLCRIGEQTGCNMRYHATAATLYYIKNYMEQKHPAVMATFKMMTHLSQLHGMAQQLGNDQMLAVVLARPESISYQRLMANLPEMLSHSFSHTSTMLVYPDQWGDPTEMPTVFAPNGRAVTSNPETMGNWFAQAFKKNNS